jgi:hypothetical protein
MFSFFQRHPLIIALSVLAAILAVVVAAELGFGGSRAQPGGGAASRSAPFEAKLLPPQQVAQAEQLYPEMAARPLFTPTRRPAPAAAPPSTYTPGQFVLQGVIVAGNTRTAMLREKASGRTHRVEVGREINGVKVAEIDREVVTLTQGGDREVLQLQVQRPGAVGGQGAAAGAAGAAGAAAMGPFGPTPGTAGSPVSPPGTVPGAPPQAPGAAPRPTVPPPLQSPGAILNAPNPLAAPAPGTNPAQPSATTTPMSPEELLARRRARRGQQSQ